LDTAGKIDYKGYIRGSPVFIHTGMEDKVFPPANQNAVYDLYHYFLQAKVEHVRDQDAGHYFKNDVPGKMIKYLYDNIPSSG
jgi:predicted esterase